MGGEDDECRVGEKQATEMLKVRLFLFLCVPAMQCERELRQFSNSFIINFVVVVVDYLFTNSSAIMWNFWSNWFHVWVKLRCPNL